MSYLDSKIWELVPNKIKEAKTLNTFKFRIRSSNGVHAEYAKYILGKRGLYLHIKASFQ